MKELELTDGRRWGFFLFHLNIGIPSKVSMSNAQNYQIIVND